MPNVRPALILLLATLGLIALTARAIDRPTPRNAIEKQEITYRIDLNTADAATLSLLPGVGPGIAQRIVDHRNAHGPFTTIAEIENVPYIGPLKRQAIEPWVVIE